MKRFSVFFGSGIVLVLLATANVFAHTVIAGKVEYGLAAQYPGDIGIGGHPAVIHTTGFETPQWAVDEFGPSSVLREGYEHTTDPDLVMAGAGSLQIQQTQGTHQPYEFQPSIRSSDSVYVRWYRRYEAGYDWTQHKMPGVYAKNPPNLNTSAGEIPNGCDKYSCKLFVDWSGRPAFYSYHPDQQGIYGDHFAQNIGTPVTLETERWYCFEMMIKSNTPGLFDGELKMWIDGILKGHVDGLRFRFDNCNDGLPLIQINKFTHSAYVGGTWVSERDQKLWEDNLVIANQYIGPMAETDPPAVRTVQVHESGEQVAVEFDRQVDESDAQRAGNYLIDQGVGVLSAGIGADHRTVILTTTALVPGRSYTLIVDRILGSAPGAEATGIEAVFQVPRFRLLVDFGAEEAGNRFGDLGWNEVIKDVYTHYADIGPGGTTIGVGSNASYNFQGLRGAAHGFSALDQIRVTWHNASDDAITFSPSISFDDPDRIASGQAGTWQPMAAWYNPDLKEIEIPAGATRTCAFAFNAQSAGSHGLVNVNVNYGNNRELVCDRIVMDGGGESCLVSSRQINAGAPPPGGPSVPPSSSSGGSGCFITGLVERSR